MSYLYFPMVKKRRFLYLICLFIILFFVSQASATTRTYVSNSTGSQAYSCTSSACTPFPSASPPTEVPEALSKQTNRTGATNIAVKDSSGASITARLGYVYLMVNLNTLGIDDLNKISQINYTASGWNQIDGEINWTIYTYNFQTNAWNSCGSVIWDSNSQESGCVIQNLNMINQSNNFTYILIQKSINVSSTGTVDALSIEITYSNVSASYESPTISNGTYRNVNNILVNVSSPEATLDKINIRLYNSTRNLLYSNLSSTSSYFINYTGLTDGIYYFNATVNITTGESRDLETRMVTVDTTRPAISVVFPTNNSNRSSSSLTINYTVSDTNLNSCWWTNNSGTTNTSITCGQNLSQSLGDGLKTYTFYTNDSAGNTNSSSVTFRIDTTSPSLTLVHPAGSEEFTTNLSLPINYTISDSGVGLGTCWYNVDNGANVTLPNCANATFNTSDGSHIFNFFANDTLNNRVSQSNPFTISLNAPAISLNAPTNGTYWNNGTNFYLNYTATDANGISRCEIYTNHLGSFTNIVNNTGITSGVMNFTRINATDGSYKWNVFCVDTTAQGRFATNNLTFVIDLTNPVVNLNDPTTTVGSQTVNFTFTITETNPNTCKYSIFDSGGNIDGLNNNVSVTCGTTTSATVTAYGTYTLRVYSLDLAGNEGYSDKQFTTSASSGDSGGGGGGGGSGESQIPVIGLQAISPSDEAYDDLDRMIMYAVINNYCSENINEEELAVVDYSDTCSLGVEDFTIILERLEDFGVDSTTNDISLFYENYKDKLFFQGFTDSATIQRYGLFASVLGLTTFLEISPSSLDKYFTIINPSGSPTNLTFTFLSNKDLKTCEVISETTGITCEIQNSTRIVVTQYLDTTDYFTRIYSGTVLVTTDAPSDELEQKRVNAIFRVLNLGNEKFITFGIGAGVVLIGGFFMLGRKGKEKIGRFIRG